MNVDSKVLHWINQKPNKMGLIKTKQLVIWSFDQSITEKCKFDGSVNNKN